MANSEVIQLDGKTLKAIANKNHTSSVAATALAMRERIRTETDIKRTQSSLIRSGEKINKDDFLAFWEDLQNAGVGEIKYGRKNKPHRFNWFYSLKDVSKAMLEGVSPKVRAVSNRTSQEEAVDPGVEPLAQKIKFFLTPTRMVEVRAPDNLTEEEATKIAKGLKTLVSEG